MKRLVRFSVCCGGPVNRGHRKRMLITFLTGQARGASRLLISMATAIRSVVANEESIDVSILLGDGRETSFRRKTLPFLPDICLTTCRGDPNRDGKLIWRSQITRNNISPFCWVTELAALRWRRILHWLVLFNAACVANSFRWHGEHLDRHTEGIATQPASFSNGPPSPTGNHHVQVLCRQRHGVLEPISLEQRREQHGRVRSGIPARASHLRGVVRFTPRSRDGSIRD